MPNIFHYSDPSQFLYDSWRTRNAVNPAFSLSAWSKKLGFSNSSPLSLMLRGKRPIPKKYLPAIVMQLGLSSNEARYLELLVDCRQAKTPDARQYYYRQIREITPQQSVKMVELECFKYLEDPLHMALLEMSDLANFSDDPEWIQRRLSFTRNQRQIREAIDRLLNLGLLRRDNDQRLRKCQVHLSTPSDLRDDAVTQYHQHVSAMAIDAVKQQTVKRREFNGFAFNIARRDLPKAKRMIRAFVDTFIREMEAPPLKGDATYQLNVQFFELTKPDKDDHSCEN